mgnify:CR=1 FL=1
MLFLNYIVVPVGAFVWMIYTKINNHHTCDYDLNVDNPIKQAYDHLKTLPEFSGAVDV